MAKTKKSSTKTNAKPVAKVASKAAAKSTKPAAKTPAVQPTAKPAAKPKPDRALVLIDRARKEAIAWAAKALECGSASLGTKKRERLTQQTARCAGRFLATTDNLRKLVGGAG